jgi:23S rRNA pseudouridine2605 synthase
MADKLQKILANAGLGSRRGVEKWIEEGRVSVNGLVAKIGDRAEDTDRIAVDGKPIKIVVQRHRHLLYNKPANEICTRDDPEGRRSVFKSLPRVEKQRWISVGRLDYSTTGLLLFTTDGELANKLMHPSFQIEREYAVRVLGHVSEEKLNAMREGVLLEDGVAKFTDIQKGQEEDESANQWYYVVIMEGRNREVRRLWESQDLTVSRLKRTRYGSFFIPSAVKAGKSIELKGKDVTELYLMAGVDTKGRPEAHSDEDSARPAKRQSNWGKSKRRSSSRETNAESRASDGSVRWKKPQAKGAPREGTPREGKR